MESSYLMHWVRLGFWLVIGLISTCVLYTICKLRQDIATAGDDVAIPIHQSRSAIIRSLEKPCLVFSEDRSRKIPEDRRSARNV